MSTTALSKQVHPRLKIFSFFSGCGFLDLGFELNGFSIEFVNEFHLPFLRAYEYSRKLMGIAPPIFGCHNTDVNEYLDGRRDELCEYMNVAKADGSLVGFIGGPPCPDFSVAGKQRGKNGDNGKLSLSYVKLIITFLPDFFLFENVKGLWKTAKHREFYEELKGMLGKSGYLMTERLTNALEFGVPQDRDRILLFGVKNGGKKWSISQFPWSKYIKYDKDEVKNIKWPKSDPFKEDGLMECPHGIKPELTVQYWFDKNNVNQHPNCNDFFRPKEGLRKMLVVEEGDVSKKSHKRLHRWRYSPTVAYGNNEVHLHPYKARRLTVAESLALQSLPKEFVLPPDMTLTDKFKTIGNGVPFLLAEGLAKTIRDYLTSNQSL